MASVTLLMPVLAALLLMLHPSHAGQQIPARVSAEQHRAAWAAASEAAGGTLQHDDPSVTRGRFSPITFGGDPTGVADSTVAIQRAIKAAFGVVNPSAWCNVSTPAHNTAVDLGGGTFDVSLLSIDSGVFEVCTCSHACCRPSGMGGKAA